MAAGVEGQQPLELLAAEGLADGARRRLKADLFILECLVGVSVVSGLPRAKKPLFASCEPLADPCCCQLLSVRSQMHLATASSFRCGCLCPAGTQAHLAERARTRRHARAADAGARIRRQLLAPTDPGRLCQVGIAPHLVQLVLGKEGRAPGREGV